jgi:hypothetical protein
MNSGIHIEMLREGEASVRLKVRSAPGEPVVFEHSLRVLSIITPNDTVASLQSEITKRCHTWYERQINLDAYCEVAGAWSTELIHREHNIRVRMKRITAEQAVWEYYWEREWHSGTLSFNDCEMCVDWVCDSGLTEHARRFIADCVRRDIAHHEEKSSAANIKKRKLAEQFLAPLPPYIDVASEVSKRLYSPSGIHPPLQLEIKV